MAGDTQTFTVTITNDQVPENQESFMLSVRTDTPGAVAVAPTATGVINDDDGELVNTVEPSNNGHAGDEHFVHFSEVVFGGKNVWTIIRQGVNSLSIVGRLSTLQSAHYQRFHCSCNACSVLEPASLSFTHTQI